MRTNQQLILHPAGRLIEKRKHCKTNSLRHRCVMPTAAAAFSEKKQTGKVRRLCRFAIKNSAEDDQNETEAIFHYKCSTALAMLK